MNPITLNRYDYAGNNPVMYADPSGHRTEGTSSGHDTQEGQIYSTAYQYYTVKDPNDVNNIEENSTKIIAGTIVTAALAIVTSHPKVVEAAVPVTVGSEKVLNEAEDVATKVATEAPQKVIGHYPEYVEMSNKLGVKPFSIPDAAWNKMTSVEQWAANQKFLDRAIAKGSEFNLATPIDKVRPGSYLVKEIQYLISQGYKLSSDGTKFIK